MGDVPGEMTEAMRTSCLVTCRLLLLLLLLSALSSSLCSWG